MRLVVKQVRLNYCETEGSAPVPSALMVAGKDLPWYDAGSLAFGWGSVKWLVVAGFGIITPCSREVCLGPAFTVGE